MHRILSNDNGTRLLKLLNRPRRLLLWRKERHRSVIPHPNVVNIALDINIVLDTNWNAIQNTKRLARRPALRRRPRRLEGQMVRAVRIGPGVAVQAVRLRRQGQERLDDLERRDLAGLVHLVVVAGSVVASA